MSNSNKNNNKSWLEERIPVTSDQIKELTNEPVPNHMKHWWFCLGGTPAYLFVIQIVTGIMLAFYYQPSPASAYDSIKFINEIVPYGWYIRGIHKWAATLMIAAVILHQIRIYFTAAYRRPRELNWMIGMALLMCTLVIGFTGYSLVYEQLSYWGASVGANIANSVPYIGSTLKHILLAGDAYNQYTLSRFFMLHAAILPGTMIILIIIHIAFIRMHGVTELEFKSDSKKKKKFFNFFPDHVISELMVGLVLMILLTFLATVFPAILGPKADPLTTPEVIKPEWFFYIMFRWLKLFSGTFAILSSGLIVFTMFVWPFIDSWLVKKFKKPDLHVTIGIIAIIIMTILTVWEAIVEH